MKTGLEIISDERTRQITDEGYTPGMDDNQTLGELALAAACYSITYYLRDSNNVSILPWPWAPKYYKPNKNPDKTGEGRIHELAKAGALIAAEIDRLQRLKEKELEKL